MMPFIRRNFFEPVHGFLAKSPKLPYWKHLEKTQYYSHEALSAIGWRRLKGLLDFVWENNAFYRQRLEQNSIRPADIQRPEDMRRLEILTKNDIRKNSVHMISRGYPVDGLLKVQTGGSTGKALELFLNEECSEQRNACARRHDCWTGWKPGEPVAACWGNPHFPEKLKDKLATYLLTPMIFLDTMRVDEAAVRAFVAQWQRVRPTLLFGHAHSLFLLAQYLKNLNINSLTPKGILSTSMMLIPAERQLIEEVFGVKVIDRYGCEEVGLIACECERHEGMHLNIEHLFIEFLREDGTPAANGEPGRIVITDLLNLAMPLIRYQVEDVGVPTGRRCSCGRGLPLMEGVAGRVADFLIRPDGSRVAGISLIENSLTRLPGIDQMQIVQEDYREIVLRVVLGEEYSAEVERQLVTYFHSVFGQEAKIQVVPVEQLAPEQSGKFRFSICRIR